MAENKHTIGTANRKKVPLSFCELVKRRPKIARRRVTDRELICAINSYDLNRGTQAEQVALAVFEALYGRRPVGL